MLTVTNGYLYMYESFFGVPYSFLVSSKVATHLYTFTPKCGRPNHFQSLHKVLDLQWSPLTSTLIASQTNTKYSYLYSNRMDYKSSSWSAIVSALH